jgi:hypothetical protein
MSELESQQCDTGDKRNVLEMLERIGKEEEEDGDEEDGEFEEIDSDDEEDDTDLAERLGEVDLNNADAVWERLTDAEKEEFKTIVHNGDVEKIVASIEPFWKQKIEQLVIEVAEGERRIKEIRENCPAVIDNIKSFKEISSKPPAKCVVYNVANVIVTYR